jgi:hypothetical protein
MTNLEIMVTVLSETIGKLASDCEQVIKAGMAAQGVDIATQTKLLDEVPDDEAGQLLSALRQEKAGILNWIIEGKARSL